MFPQELEQQFERERQSLEEQKALLRQQLDELREELTAKLTAANEEVNIKNSLFLIYRVLTCHILFAAVVF